VTSPLDRLRGGLGRFLTYGSLVLASTVALVPLVALFIASLKTDSEFAKQGVFDAPSNWFNFGNYATALVEGKMLEGFANTIFILGISIVGTVLIGSMAAFAISRFEFRLKRTVVFLFLLAAIVPTVTAQVTTFQVVNAMHLFNTRFASILLFIGTDIVSIYIFLQFMRGIPKALDEAALLDGATQFTIYRKVVFPLLKPAIATVVIIKGVAVYNEFYIPWLYMPSHDLGVVATSLFRFTGPFGARWDVIAAGVVISMIPTLVTFLLLQRWIYNGFTRGVAK
jgi:ABC-type glycerol-3-phosphate transport system permease component